MLFRQECMLLSKKQVKSLKQFDKVTCILEFSIVKENDLFTCNFSRLQNSQIRQVLIIYNQSKLNNPNNLRITID